MERRVADVIWEMLAKAAVLLLSLAGCGKSGFWLNLLLGRELRPICI